ncbi:glutamate-1-semialdehyde-2,1-aminomutase [Thermanaerovibrio velox DSM 12556]|uniref:Glutamate-1-semialdehyde 2,1-aminomutase n=1 Tax=Thermanaerovibrio velox DSM 12556 TaxID=926567 RepID=H0UMV4_9BACT|nr:glutamate-1-semialdehyde 2,1-aminomutase [Thermanaerovibrio velox]EHM09249.1 glutamate-1-semialdehyde-2,1-aminomutase [Thermanaerovibrio velox DSM 12556]
MVSSKECFERAKRCLVGGVNSPVRAFRAVGGEPVFFKSAKGCRLFDVEDNSYVDYVCSWGPMILGHGDPHVLDAVHRAVEEGLSFGACSPLEARLGEMIKDKFPSIRKLRFTSSGTEAVMGAVRLARGFTGRDVIIKFEGCYHGHSDSLLVSAGSGALTFGTPSSPGVTRGCAADTLVIRYNHLEEVEAAFRACGERIAAVIVEPWGGNMGLVPPEKGFLRGLRDITLRHGSLLIFDEVITGFRVPEGGVQNLEGIEPDITCLGKIIGGGMPVGAFGGREDVMSRLSPEGPVYQAGTLSGNPVAMACGIATLERLTPESYRELESKGAALERGILDAAHRAGITVSVSRLGSALGLFFGPMPKDLEGVKGTRVDLYPRFFNHMLSRGFYFPPSAYETFFVSLAHDDQVIDATVRELLQAFIELRGDM